jgi:hypothetical protein
VLREDRALSITELLDVICHQATYEVAVDASDLKSAYNDLNDDPGAISIYNPLFAQIPLGRLRKKCLDKINYRASRARGCKYSAECF